MAALISGGMDELRERPIMSAGACTVSPLKIPRDVSEVCLTMARAGLPDAPHGDDARRRHRAGDASPAPWSCRTRRRWRR